MLRAATKIPRMGRKKEPLTRSILNPGYFNDASLIRPQNIIGDIHPQYRDCKFNPDCVG